MMFDNAALHALESEGIEILCEAFAAGGQLHF